jgi:hypothetical protein
MAKSKKPKSKPPRGPNIKRITVDERFSDWSIRFLIATLAAETVTPDKKIEFQNINCWNPEKCFYVTRENFQSRLGIGGNKKLLDCAVKEVIGEVKQKPTANLLWLGLEEGQVFIVGNFQVQGDRFEPEYLAVSSTPAIDFLRVDRIERFKDNSKNLYSRALRGKEKI